MAESGTATGGKTRKRQSQRVPAHPSYSEMIKTAIGAVGDRNGASRQAIQKYIKEHYKVGDKADGQVKLALKRLADHGTIVLATGTGVSGSFRLGGVTRISLKKKVAKKTTVSKPKARVSRQKVTSKAKTKVKQPAPKKMKRVAKPKKDKAATPKKAMKRVKVAKSPAKKQVTKKLKMNKRSQSPKKRIATKKAAKPKVNVRKAKAKKK
uniref:histone H1.0-B-like n=1 Tax=Myxine glutinosa TaxID=7769 RepID=UPI00358FA8FF